MKRSIVPLILVLVIAGAAIGTYGLAPAQEAMSFGGDKDVTFANNVWAGMKGYMDWPMSSDVYPGTSPHGKFLRVYYNVVNVDGKPYHVIVKDNYAGEGVSQEAASKNPGKFLAAVTIMVQREPGYDKENNDWFWVKYKGDGSIEKNDAGVAMAGRVAKGSDKGCIACHSHAKQGDYVFTNDE